MCIASRKGGKSNRKYIFAKYLLYTYRQRRARNAAQRPNHNGCTVLTMSTRRSHPHHRALGDVTRCAYQFKFQAHHWLPSPSFCFGPTYKNGSKPLPVTYLREEFFTSKQAAREPMKSSSSVAPRRLSSVSLSAPLLITIYPSTCS